MAKQSSFITNQSQSRKSSTGKIVQPSYGPSAPSEGAIKFAVQKGWVTEERARELSANQLACLMDGKQAIERANRLKSKK